MAVALLCAACNFNLNEVTPTVEGVEQTVEPLPGATNTPLEPTPSLTLSPSLAPTRAIITLEIRPLPPEQANITPTDAPTATPTPGPYLHTVRAGESLFGIVGQYGYNDPSVIPLIVTANNLGSADNIREGQQLIIPRQTALPTAVGFELTLTAEATRGIFRSGAFEGAFLGCHIVAEGDTAISIAAQYNTTLEILRDLNPELGWTGCDFSNPSGGPQCSVNFLRIGECVDVPLPTPTPTLSPTPSGSETPTSTPTYAPPPLSSPPDGAVVRGAIMLSWVSAGVLRRDEFYLLELVELDTATGEPLAGADAIQVLTRETGARLPAEALPLGGAPRLFAWRVMVVAELADGRFTGAGGQGAPRRFTVTP
jgi:hypothetical protein